MAPREERLLRDKNAFLTRSSLPAAKMLPPFEVVSFLRGMATFDDDRGAVSRRALRARLIALPLLRDKVLGTTLRLRRERDGTTLPGRRGARREKNYAVIALLAEYTACRACERLLICKIDAISASFAEP